MFGGITVRVLLLMAIGWLVLSLGLLVGVGVVAGIIYMTRREIRKV